MKPEMLITLSALIAVFAGLYTLVVFKRRQRAPGSASTEANDGSR